MLIQEAIRRGYEVTFVCKSIDYYRGAPYSEVLSHVNHIFADTTDLGDAITHLLRLDSVSPLDALACVSEYHLINASIIAHVMGLVGPSVNGTISCRNKALMAHKLQEANVVIPASWLVIDGEETQKIVPELSFPVVAKPLDRSSSTNVKLINNSVELEEHAIVVAGEHRNNRGFSRLPYMLVQEYIPGMEYSVETLSRGSEIVFFGITEKHSTEPPYFVEMGHVYPAAISNSLAYAIRDTVKQALLAVGYTDGPAHTEVKINGTVPTVIEINPRLGGDLIPELIERSGGESLYSAYISWMLGTPRPAKQSSSKCAGIQFVVAPESGQLIRFDMGNEETEITRGATAKIGDIVYGPPQRSSHRLGHVIATGRTQKFVTKILTDQIKKIRIEVSSHVTHDIE